MIEEARERLVRPPTLDDVEPWPEQLVKVAHAAKPGDLPPGLRKA